LEPSRWIRNVEEKGGTVVAVREAIVLADVVGVGVEKAMPKVVVVVVVVVALVTVRLVEVGLVAEADAAADEVVARITIDPVRVAEADATVTVVTLNGSPMHPPLRQQQQHRRKTALDHPSK